MSTSLLAKQWVVTGAAYAFLSVVLGAFGGHGLKDVLDPKAFSVFLIGVQYQMYHALALLALGLWAGQHPTVNTSWVGWAFTLGVALFSFSLYALALTDIKILGLITPIGGVLFLMGWIGFVFKAWKV